MAAGGLRETTMLRYRGPAASWLTYCRDRGELAHDASTGALMRWLDWRCREAKSPPATIKMSLAAARYVQSALCAVHGFEVVPYSPDARVQLDVFCRALTLQPRVPKQARPLRLDELLMLVRRVRGDLSRRRGVDTEQAMWLADRDAAMLLVGWWGALRGDDLARLKTADIRPTAQGLELHLRASKTTHAAIALVMRPDAPELCPWAAWNALQAWPVGHARAFGLTASSHVRRRIAYLFRKHRVPRGYSSHSLRAGFATEAAAQGVPDRLVQNHGRWRSAQQHAEYVRGGRLWQDTPTEKIACPIVPTLPRSASETGTGDASPAELDFPLDSSES